MSALYNKPSLDVSSQVKLLQSKGLIINDISFTEEFLKNNSYARLKKYFRIFQTKSNKSYQFLPKTTFDDIYCLYIFDKKLRMCLFNYIEEIEVSFRTRLFNILSDTYGKDWIYDLDIYKNDNLQSSMKTIVNVLSSKQLNNDNEIQEFKTTYSSINKIPAWMLSDFFTFGEISRLFGNFNYMYKYNNIALQTIIDNQLCIDIGVANKGDLKNILHNLVLLRNEIAHHGIVLKTIGNINFYSNDTFLSIYNNSYEGFLITHVYWINGIMCKIRSSNHFLREIKNIFFTTQSDAPVGAKKKINDLTGLNIIGRVCK